MQSFRDVIDRWPDVATFAGDLDVSAVLVRKWKERNYIPSDYWATVVRAAKARRIAGVTADLLVRLGDRQAAA